MPGDGELLVAKASPGACSSGPQPGSGLVRLTLCPNSPLHTRTHSHTLCVLQPHRSPMFSHLSSTSGLWACLPSLCRRRPILTCCLENSYASFKTLCQLCLPEVPSRLTSSFLCGPLITPPWQFSSHSTPTGQSCVLSSNVSSELGARMDLILLHPMAAHPPAGIQECLQDPQ